MGIKEWREKTLARIDAQADRFDAKAQELEAKSRRLEEESRDRREQAAVDGLEAWRHERAASLGEDHEDLVQRAAALGMGVPVPRQPGKVEGAALAVTRGLDRIPGVSFVASLQMAQEGAGTGLVHEEVDPYQAWRNRIVVEEQMVAKQAAGERLGTADRLLLKVARASWK